MLPDGLPGGPPSVSRLTAALGLEIPPVRRRAFWGVQGLVLLIAGTHTLLETVGRVHFPPPLYLVPTSLFFVPVTYAALRFGVRGSLTTALWSILLTLPNILLLHAGLERFGVLWQLGTMLVIALFVGIRVDLARVAQADTETRERELQASEERYRALFDNAAEAVLVIDAHGLIEDANGAAARLLGAQEGLAGRRVAAVVGEALSAVLATPGMTRQPVAFTPPGGSALHWIEPVISGPLEGVDGASRTQVMLHDVTLRHERQQGLERYARRTVTAREEERRRIGRDLHDGPLQALMMVGRKLDLLDDGAAATDGSHPLPEAREILERTADEVRRISRALRPSILDDLGLVPALRSEVTALGRRSSLRVRFRAPRSIHASPEVELLLLRVTQEALRNVEKHAAATQASVRLGTARGKLLLVIRDDGRGPGNLPSAAELLGAGSLGVVGMEERARLAGGDFTIRHARPTGTTVGICVPTGEIGTESR
jgi:signal transduction histidine kinase